MAVNDDITEAVDQAEHQVAIRAAFKTADVIAAIVARTYHNHVGAQLPPDMIAALVYQTNGIQWAQTVDGCCCGGHGTEAS